MLTITVYGCESVNGNDIKHKAICGIAGCGELNIVGGRIDCQFFAV